MTEPNPNLDSTDSTDSAPTETEETRRIGSSLGMKILSFIMRFTPFLAYGFALIPVVWYFWTKPEGRRAAAILFRRLGKKGGTLTRLRFGFSQARMFSKIILDNMYLGLFGKDRFVLREEGTDTLRSLLAEGKGLVLLSAHMGNWHLAVNFLSNTKTRVHLVMDDVRQEEVRRRMDAAKAVSEHLTVHGAEAGPGLAFELSAALRRGEAVIIAGDRIGDRGRRTRISFLGEEAWFPTAALNLAAAVGAPVCTALSFREGSRKYVCYGVGPLSIPPEAASRRDAKVQAMLREFVHALETYVRKYPEQWFNFYDFWKK